MNDGRRSLTRTIRVAAQRWYHQSIESSPHSAHGHIYLGAMLARCGRLNEAEAADRRGTLCKTGAVDEAFLNLGLVLRAQER